ncbi:MAG: hypothetical protein U9R29_05430 [Thermodesulfobacteriota bacterium]|nr:hypothetical protein [Thermodesulfobacteriota bacterium]
MKFNDKLVLNSWLLSLLGMDSFESLAKEFDDSILLGVDENENSYFYNRLVNNIIAVRKKISNDKLQGYDENIVRHTKAMGREIKWKYFQYLSLLFIEIIVLTVWGAKILNSFILSEHPPQCTECLTYEFELRLF